MYGDSVCQTSQLLLTLPHEQRSSDEVVKPHRYSTPLQLSFGLDEDIELESQPLMADTSALEAGDEKHHHFKHDHRDASPVDTGFKRESLTSNPATARVIAHSHDADEALKAFESGEVIEIDEATNKRLLRIIDLRMMPLMCLIYGLNYLDKTTLSYASILGIKKVHLPSLIAVFPPSSPSPPVL